MYVRAATKPGRTDSLVQAALRCFERSPSCCVSRRVCSLPPSDAAHPRFFSVRYLDSTVSVAR